MPNIIEIKNVENKNKYIETDRAGKTSDHVNEYKNSTPNQLIT
jgi:hypothetical protein